MRWRRGREGGVFGHIRLGLAAVATILVVGTVGFMLLERFSLLDALIRTIGLITTSGTYQDAATTAGKAFSLAVVVVGIGSLFYTLGSLAEYLIEGHFGRTIARHRMDRNIERLTEHGIICGFGRVGRRIAREFADAGQPIVVIDKQEANAAELEAAGFLYLLGDATEDAVLLKAGVRRAQSLLAATDDDTENIAITLSARALSPKLWIVARANREESEAKLVRAGANRVLSPYTLGGHRMAGLARQPYLMEFLDTAVKSGELDLALTVTQVKAGSPLVGMPLPASVETLPPSLHDSNVLAVRPAGRGPWLAASRREGQLVAAGDWLVVLGPVSQRQQKRAPQPDLRQPGSETAAETVGATPTSETHAGSLSA